MRASTLFALTLALLAGLGAVVAARYAGWLGKPEPPPAAKQPEIQVLVAARNLFPGDVIDGNWVRTRPLRPEEKSDYDKNKNEFLPPVQAAAALRVANKPIEADSPILRKDLKDLVKPEPLHVRLLPNMRAINLSLQKDQSAGGLIQVGEWVDVYLTSTVSTGSTETTRTAPVAQGLRVIAKRNALWSVFAGLPENKPVNFTLEANPYRAGLLEFSKTKGNLSMVPLSASEQRVLEEKRTKLLATTTDVKLLPVSFAQANSNDSSGEEGRVEAFNRGEYTISHSDLIRIFDLTTPPPPRQNVVVEQYNGLSQSKTTHFDPDGRFLRSEDPRKGGTAAQAARSSARSEQAPSPFDFSAPGCGPGKGCPTCKKK